MSRKKTEAEKFAEMEAREKVQQERWQTIKDSFESSDHIVYSMPCCVECGALIDNGEFTREKHYDWHRRTETR